MNFSEFKKRLGAEPLSRDPDLREARASGPEFEAAAAEAEAFERKLEGALKFAVDGRALAAELAALPQAAPAHNRRWLAIAASVLVLVGAGGVALYQANQPVSLEQYVSTHIQHDGERLLSLANEDFDRSEVYRLMSLFEVTVAPELAGKVTFIKLCPTLNGKGAHMIVSSENGQVSVLYMPHTEIEATRVVLFDDMQADIIALDSGSAAIVRKAGQATPEIERLVRSGLRPLLAGA